MNAVRISIGLLFLWHVIYVDCFIFSGTISEKTLPTATYRNSLTATYRNSRGFKTVYLVWYQSHFTALIS